MNSIKRRNFIILEFIKVYLVSLKNILNVSYFYVYKYENKNIIAILFHKLNFGLHKISNEAKLSVQNLIIGVSLLC